MWPWSTSALWTTLGSRASLLPCCLFCRRVWALTQRARGREDGKTSGHQEGKPAQDTSPEGSVPPSPAQGPLCTPVRAPTTCLVPSTFLLPAPAPTLVPTAAQTVVRTSCYNPQGAGARVHGHQLHALQGAGFRRPESGGLEAALVSCPPRG